MGVVCGGDPNKEAMHTDIEQKLRVHVKEWPEAVITFKKHHDDLGDLWEEDDSDKPEGCLAPKRKVRPWFVNEATNRE